MFEVRCSKFDVRSSMLNFGELFELFESFLGKFWANKTLQKVSNFIIVIQNGLKYGKKVQFRAATSFSSKAKINV